MLKDDTEPTLPLESVLYSTLNIEGEEVAQMRSCEPGSAHRHVVLQNSVEQPFKGIV